MACSMAKALSLGQMAPSIRVNSEKTKSLERANTSGLTVAHTMVLSSTGLGTERESTSTRKRVLSTTANGKMECAMDTASSLTGTDLSTRAIGNAAWSGATAKWPTLVAIITKATGKTISAMDMAKCTGSQAMRSILGTGLTISRAASVRTSG